MTFHYFGDAIREPLHLQAGTTLRVFQMDPHRLLEGHRGHCYGHTDCEWASISQAKIDNGDQVDRGSGSRPVMVADPCAARWACSARAWRISFLTIQCASCDAIQRQFATIIFRHHRIHRLAIASISSVFGSRSVCLPTSMPHDSEKFAIERRS